MAGRSAAAWATVPGRAEGFCPRCGEPFSFLPGLRGGDVVGGQYEIVGCLAHGGLGWVYLARDRNVDDVWRVLKGVIHGGDPEAIANAIDERRFLASVDHPNIVKIINFVEHDGAGYIVMEYVDGVSLRQLLSERRSANDGGRVPLPLTHAISYVLEILPALGHLHDQGLLFCDFKPENVMCTASSVKLIDLGGVYRIDDRTSPVYGTPGYQAPEIADTGPTIASDLFTVARTLAVLCCRFPDFRGAYRFALPPPRRCRTSPATTGSTGCCCAPRPPTPTSASSPPTRWRISSGAFSGRSSPRRPASRCPGPARSSPARWSGASTHPTGTASPCRWCTSTIPRRRTWPRWGPTTPTHSSMRSTPRPSARSRWTFSSSGRCCRPAATTRPTSRSPRSNERLRGTGAPSGTWACTTSSRGHPGRPCTGSPRSTGTCPVSSRRSSPWRWPSSSEVTRVRAAEWYDRVSRTDASFTAASFGLARCREALGDSAGADDAYGRVPNTSSHHVEAQVAAARLRLGPAADVAEVEEAGRIIDALTLDPARRAALTADVLEAALP